MRIQWQPSYDLRGNGYGYTTHQKSLKAALERAGVEFGESDLVVDINTPPSAKLEDGKFNVLYSMYECATIPDHWVEHTRRPDLMVVPCSHNKHLFSRYTDVPIEIVWEGIDPTKFQYVDRAWNPEEERFTFLWIGASNPRKGYEHIILAWERFTRDHPEEAANSKIIMKTTQVTREERLVSYPVHLSNGGVAETYVDTRDYSKENLINLYAIGHCFLFPTMGEGWGLTMHEAAATGLPIIYTPYSAPTDWFKKDHGYPLRFRMKDIKTEGKDGQIVHETSAASADVDDLVKKMVRVYHNWEDAKRRGRKASEHVKTITWDRSAQEFLDKIRPHYEAWKKQQEAVA